MRGYITSPVCIGHIQRLADKEQSSTMVRIQYFFPLRVRCTRATNLFSSLKPIYFKNHNERRHRRFTLEDQILTYFKWAPGAENEEIKTKETNRKKLSRTMSKGVRSCFRSLSVRLPRSRAFPMCDGVVLTSTPLCASFLRYSRRQWSRVRAFSMRDCHRVGLLSASKLSLRVS